MIEDPVFIIGTERSGSNLLRLILNSHTAIAVPHPPHIVRDFSPFVRFYGDLKNEKNLRNLVHDVSKVVNHHFAPWPFRIEPEEVLGEVRIRSLYGIHAALYELFRKSQGKSRWACKSTFMYAEIPDITKAHSKPKFLHLVRDPRDVAASAKRSIFSSYHPVKEAGLWQAQQQKIRELREKYLKESSYLHVSYEELVSSPDSTTQRIMNFLELPFERDQLNYFKSDEAQQLSRLSRSWENCGLPVTKEKIGRFRKHLTPAEVAQIETLLGGSMKEYGYTRESMNEVSIPSDVVLEIQEILMMIGAEARALVQDRNTLFRWNKRMLIHRLKLQRKLEKMFHRRGQGAERWT